MDMKISASRHYKGKTQMYIADVRAIEEQTAVGLILCMRQL